MKKWLIFFASIIVSGVCMAQPVTCSVSIEGDTCTSTLLTAKPRGGIVDSLIWYWDGTPMEFRYYLGYSNDAVKYAGGVDGIIEPIRMCLDMHGNVYTTSSYSCDVKKWVPGIDTPQVVAGYKECGRGPKSLSSPVGLFVDSADNLYVAESGLGKISKWAPGANEKVVVASNGLISPWDVFVDKKGIIYVADYDGGTVTKWMPGATTGIIVAHGLILPDAVVVDENDNVYVSDEGNLNPKVTKWIPGSNVGETIAGGNGTSNSNSIHVISPEDIALDKNGHLLIADATNQVIVWPKSLGHKVAVAGGYGTTPGSKFFIPQAIDLDNEGNLYVLATNQTPPNFVYKFKLSNKIDTNFAPNSDYLEYKGNYVVKTFFRNGCIAKDSISLNTYPLPWAYISGQTGALCGVSVKEYEIIQAEGASRFDWVSSPFTTILSGQGTPKISLLISGGFKNGKLGVTASNTCGEMHTYINLEATPSNPTDIIGPSYVQAFQDSLSYKVFPEEEGVTYTWTVPADATILRYGQGSARIFVKWGSTQDYIYVSAKNACGSANRTDKKFIRLRAGFSGDVRKISLQDNEPVVYPNPSQNGKFFVDMHSLKRNVFITVSRTDGKIIYASNALSGNQFIVDLKGQAKGIYYMRILSEDDVVTQKIVIQ